MTEPPPAICDGSSERRVVVAEDNSITRRLMATWLEQAGYQVSCAVDGRDALKAIESSSPSIVVTDWNMPQMSGPDLCRAIRRDEQRPYVYILMVTSREDRKDVIEAIDAGADDFVVKPVREAELLARVDQAEAALSRFRRYVELAETDALTGMMNRRRFNEQCVREIAAAARDGSPLSCALLDIDLFKHINDTYGHSVGDAALEAIADVLKHHTRDGDYVCRYGGDEFCILLPGMQETAACAFAERIRASVAALELTGDKRPVSLKATFGVAQWRQNLMTPRQLIDLADEAMLAAKRSGRDRVVSYAEFSNLRYLDNAVERKYQKQFAEVVAGDIMTAPVATLSQGQPLVRAADLFLRLRINSMPIVNDESRLVGIISEKDVLNSVGVDDNWDRPIGDVMKKNVVAYDVQTPVVVIWEFLQRVTLRRVVIVDNDVPTGVISRGTLLRWLGNWGAILARHERSDSLEPLELLCTHIHAAASAILLQAERLQQEVAISADSAVPIAVNAATRLQEQAQDLLALCQVHYKFEPRCLLESQAAECAGGPSVEVPNSPPLDSARAF